MFQESGSLVPPAKSFRVEVRRANHCAECRDPLTDLSWPPVLGLCDRLKIGKYHAGLRTPGVLQ